MAHPRTPKTPTRRAPRPPQVLSWERAQSVKGTLRCNVSVYELGACFCCDLCEHQITPLVGDHHAVFCDLPQEPRFFKRRA